MQILNLHQDQRQWSQNEPVLLLLLTMEVSMGRKFEFLGPTGAGAQQTLQMKNGVSESIQLSLILFHKCRLNFLQVLNFLIQNFTTFYDGLE